MMDQLKKAKTEKKDIEEDVRQMVLMMELLHTVSWMMGQGLLNEMIVRQTTMATHEIQRIWRKVLPALL